jgi:hypothetical protein
MPMFLILSTCSSCTYFGICVDAQPESKGKTNRAKRCRAAVRFFHTVMFFPLVHIDSLSSGLPHVVRPIDFFHPITTFAGASKIFGTALFCLTRGSTKRYT